MTPVRWIVAAVALLAGAGWLLLLTLANGFRRSFGASENGPFVTLLPLLAALAVLLAATAPLWRGGPPAPGR